MMTPESPSRAVENSGPETPVPPIPRSVLIGGVVGAALLLVFGGWIGAMLAAPSPTEPTTSPSVSIGEGAWPLEPPEVMGDLVRGEISNEDTGDRQVVRASYADGSRTILLLLSRPEADIEAYLADAGVEVVPDALGDDGGEDPATCGVSLDNGVPVCAMIRDETAIMVVAVSGQTHAEIAAHLDDFYDAMANS